MVPGALEVLPLNVQLIVVPALVIVHVSDSVGPVMPKLAVATVGAVMATATDMDVPPYDAVMMLEMVPATDRVNAENVALVAPPNTVTLAGRVAGSAPDSATLAPPEGAGADRVTVPMTDSPPTTLALSRVSAVSDTFAVTVSVGDCMLLPFIDAVIEAVPTATAVTVNVALDAPAGTVTVGGTVATAALLLASARLTPPAGATAASVTVPCPLPPAATLVVLSATADMAVVDVAAVDEPPH